MLIPNNRPQIKREVIESILDANNIPKDTCNLVGIRGYFLDSMGQTGVNDRGLYDDCLVWISPTLFASYNANVDPSKFRPGFGRGDSKGIAQLMTGKYKYCTGIHYGSIPHAAFRQAGRVYIMRDGTNGPYRDYLDSSINIHRGGNSGTSSLGCQTLPPTQWDSFKSTGYAELKRYGCQTSFNYILIEEKQIRAGVLKV